jgi:hypothetical protein
LFVQAPQFWRGPDNKLYRITRQRRPMEDAPGYVFTVRAFALADEREPAAEASVALREADLLEMVRLNQQVPTPEQLYAEAFQAVIARLGLR